MWGGNVDVTMVERNAQFVSCPISNYVIGGHAGMDRITRGYGGLKAMGVKLVQGEVTAIDAAAKKIRLKDGSEIAYDRLVLSPGIGFMSEQTGGLQPLLDNGRVLHSWQAGPQTAALRAQLEAMPDGGVFAMTIPKVPYRCPPGPYERACMVASYFKQAKPKSKVLVLDANPEVQSKKALFERAFKQHYEGILEYRANNEVREVSVSGSQLVAKLEFDDVKADVLNVIPAQRAGDLARNTAGLVNVNNRWVGVNWLTMESTAMPGVHVLGDATFSAPAMPKSGHMANQHAKVAAAAIIQLLKGEAVSATPVVMNTCYSFVTKTDVVHVASVHQYDAADKTFKTVPGSGGVSAAANQIEGRYALSWADNIWADMLAV
jgi:sulfite dehydrogenase